MAAPARHSLRSYLLGNSPDASAAASGRRIWRPAAVASGVLIGDFFARTCVSCLLVPRFPRFLFLARCSFGGSPLRRRLVLQWRELGGGGAAGDWDDEVGSRRETRGGRVGSGRGGGG